MCDVIKAAGQLPASSTQSVNPKQTPRLIDLLRSTLERVEQSDQSEEHQAAVRELRRSVVLTIAEREVRKTPQLSAEKKVTADDPAA